MSVVEAAAKASATGRSSAHERSLDDDEPTHQPVAIISIDLTLDDAPEVHCQALAARP
jgi:hypothetical protein